MTEMESRVVASWQEAARDLGIQFTTPFFSERDGRRLEGIGLVHQFGRRIGTIISVIDEPSARIACLADEDYFSSQLADSYARYDRQFFIETLDDWQFFGADSERPPWYTGSPDIDR